MYAQDLKPLDSGSIKPYNLFKGRIGRGLGKTKDVPKKTVNAIKKRFKGKVTVPVLIYEVEPGIYRVPYTIRGLEEVLPGAKASFMEQPNWYEILKLQMRWRRGGKGHTYYDICVRCLEHEAFQDTKNFKKIAPQVLELLVAWHFPYTLQNKEKREISGALIKVTERIPYSSNEEIARIEEATLEEFREILFSQIDRLIPQYPPGNREDAKWIAKRITDPVRIKKQKFEIDPYEVSVKSFKKRKAKDVYVMPPTQGHDPLSHLMENLMLKKL